MELIRHARAAARATRHSLKAFGKWHQSLRHETAQARADPPFGRQMAHYIPSYDKLNDLDVVPCKIRSACKDWPRQHSTRIQRDEKFNSHPKHTASSSTSIVSSGFSSAILRSPARSRLPILLGVFRSPYVVKGNGRVIGPSPKGSDNNTSQP